MTDTKDSRLSYSREFLLEHKNVQKVENSIKTFFATHDSDFASRSFSNELKVPSTVEKSKGLRTKRANPNSLTPNATNMASGKWRGKMAPTSNTVGVSPTVQKKSANKTCAKNRQQSGVTTVANNWRTSKQTKRKCA